MKIVQDFWFEVTKNPPPDMKTCQNCSERWICGYRLGTVNSNTVNSKFHLIQSFFEIFARFLLFHV